MQIYKCVNDVLYLNLELKGLLNMNDYTDQSLQNYSKINLCYIAPSDKNVINIGQHYPRNSY